MRICILGAGGLGSVIGGCLAESGNEVTLIARPAHVDAIRANGLRMTGIRGDRIVNEHLCAVSHPSAAVGDFDYLLLLVKSKDTASTLADATELRDRVSAALSLQNTVRKEADLSAWLGPDQVIGASTTEAGVLVEPGVVRHVATAPTACYFGEPTGGSSSRVDALVAAFNGARIASKPAIDIAHVEWEKLLQISVVAAWSVSTFGALGGSMAEGLAVRAAAEHYVQLATELLAVYRAKGYEPNDFFAPFSRFRELAEATFDDAVTQAMELGRDMREKGFIGRPSLHDDLLRGRATEVHDCVGAYLDAAAEHRVNVPTVLAAHRVITSLEFWLTRLGGVEVRPLPSIDGPRSPA